MHSILFLLTLASPLAPADGVNRAPTKEAVIHHGLLNEQSALSTGNALSAKSSKARLRARTQAASAKKSRRSAKRLQALLSLDSTSSDGVESSKTAGSAESGSIIPIRGQDSVSPFGGNNVGAQREASQTGEGENYGMAGVQTSSSPARPLPLAVLEEAELAKALIPLFILAVFAVLFTLVKKRKNGLDTVQVLESTTIGKGRQILVVEVGGQRMLLGSSEAGISVLKDRVEVRNPPRRAVDAAAFAAPLWTASPLIEGVRRALGLAPQKTGTPSTASFESHLASDAIACSEDEELRQKLSARLAAH